MTRWCTNRSAGGTARAVTRRALRRVGGAVVAASLGAAAVVVTLPYDSPARVEGADATDRAPQRPSRALSRDAELSEGPAEGLVERLLPAHALPAPSATETWSVVHTEPHEPRDLAGSCHRFPLVSVGALQVAHRAYALGPPAAPRARAEHVVARFADARTAERAHAVLLAWQADCARALGDEPDLRLSGLRDVGAAQHYSVAWRPEPSDARVREDIGLVRVGNRVALVRVIAPAAAAPTSRRTALGAVEAAGVRLG